MMRFTGTGALVRLMLRRDRVKLPAWVGGLGIFVIYVSSALPNLAPEESQLRDTVGLLAQPVGRMFTGPALGMDDPTYASFFAAGYGLYFGILVGLMNIMLVTRHTRVEEQTGRAELVRANVTGRDSILAAALVVAAITNASAGTVVAALAAAAGYPVGGSVLFGAGVAATGLAFAGITAVTVQLSEYSRGAAGMAGAVLGVAFLVRAGGDVPEVGGTTLSWFSPLAWMQQAGPYALDRWWPLVLPVALFAVAVAAAYALLARRDLGASLMAVRPGRSEASRGLGTPWGLAARLQRGGILGWGVALVLAGATNGAFAQAMVEAAEDLPEAMSTMFGGDDLLNGYLQFTAVFTGYLAAAYAVFAMQAVRAEEQRGRADAVLATPTSRSAWLGAHLLVIAAAAVAMAVLAGLATGLAAAAVTGRWSLVESVVAAHTNVIPASLVALGVAAVLFGALPRVMSPVAWLVVGLMVFVGNFAALLDLPGWLVDLSPLSHPSSMPVEPFAVAPAIGLLVVAVAGALAGLVSLRLRQVDA